MRIIVTGAAGMTGSAVVQLLVTAGHEVTALVRSHQRAVPQGTSRVVADCTVPAQVARAATGADVLIHGAGISLGTAVAEAARDARVPRVVAISSAAVYSQHRAAADAYRAGETALRALPVPVLMIRPTMIYGSRRDRNVHHVVTFVRRFRFLPVPGRGNALLQPIHYRDLAQAVAELSVSDASGTVDAGGGEAVPLRRAALAIFDAVGLHPRVLTVPIFPARAAATVLELLTRRRVRERLERALEDRTVDNARLLTLTTVRPRTFAAGVRDMVREDA